MQIIKIQKIIKTLTSLIHTSTKPSRHSNSPIHTYRDSHVGERGRHFQFFSHQNELESMCGEAKVAQRKLESVSVDSVKHWGLKAYMLVASTQPAFMVYYFPGYVYSTTHVMFPEQEDDEEGNGKVGLISSILVVKL